MGLTQNLGRLSPSIFSDSSLNIGIGAAPSGSYKFEVTGTSKVSGVLTLGATLSNGTYTYTLPAATGTLALVGGAGVGTVTSVAALTLGTTGTDLSSTVVTSTTTPVITLNVPTASASNRGALSSADWSTFNSKQGTITLTTTGTSGAATFSSNTLNIPNYSPDLSGYVTLATTQTITGAKTFNNSDLNTIFVSNPDTTGATTGSGIGFKAYNGTSVTQSAGIFLTANSWSYGTYSANQLSIGSDGTGGIALRSANSAPITFYTGGASAGVSTQRMTLNSSGNLGLGCTPPTKFAVKDGTDTVLQYYASGADGYLGMGNEAGSIGGGGKSFNLLTGTEFTFSTAGTKRVIINSSGNTSIGYTTNPSLYLLDVNGTGRFSGNLNIGEGIAMSGTSVAGTYLDARVQSAVTGNMVGYEVRMVALSPSSGSYTVANMYAIKTSTPVVQPNVTVTNSYGIYIGRTDDPSSGGVVTNRYALVTEVNAGNVGIGTSSPSTKLQVEDGYISTYHNINANSAGYGIQFLTNGGGSKNTIASIDISQVGTARSGDLIFNTSNAGAPATRLTIASTGAATFSSSIASSISGSGDNAFLLATGSGTGARYSYIANDGASAIFGIEKAAGGAILGGSSAYATVLYSNNATPLQLGTNQLVRMTITSGGNVLIGTTTDDTVNKLQVNGSVISTGYKTLEGTVSAPYNVPTLVASCSTNNGNPSMYLIITSIGGAASDRIAMAILVTISQGSGTARFALQSNGGLMSLTDPLSDGTIYVTQSTAGTQTVGYRILRIG